MVMIANVQASHSPAVALDPQRPSTPDGQMDEATGNIATQDAGPTDPVSNFVAMHGLHSAASAHGTAATSMSANAKQGAVVQEISKQQIQSHETAAQLKEGVGPDSCPELVGRWITGSDAGAGDVANSSL